MLRSFLFAPCLLICLACATPFPVDSLEEGMTTEAVRENFGEPEAINGSSWTYLHEEKGFTEWVATLVPLTYFTIPLNAAFGNSWDYTYVLRGSVDLYFEGEKLARWRVLTGPRRPEVQFDDDREFENWMDQNMEDFLDHQQGHDHHHVDHDDR